MAEAVAEKSSGLTGLDWVVVVAATVALGLLVLWLVQGPPKSLAEQKPEE